MGSKSELPGGFVDLMTDLLSSRTIREEFRSDSESVMSHYQLSPQERKSLAVISHDLLEQQAEVLLRKRWHEVLKRIPRTVEQVGETAHELFLFYGSRNWPAGHLRHVVDAVQFAEFLSSNQVANPDVAELRVLKRVLSA